jgi:hypothetical protein
MSRDLLEGIDLEDSNGIIATEFDRCRMNDDVNEFGRVLRDYVAAESEVRALMNNLFVALCGYSLPTIVERANRQGGL